MKRTRCEMSREAVLRCISFVQVLHVTCSVKPLTLVAPAPRNALVSDLGRALKALIILLRAGEVASAGTVSREQ